MRWKPIFIKFRGNIKLINLILLIIQFVRFVPSIGQEIQSNQVADFWYQRGDSLYNISQFKSAIEFLERASKLYHKIDLHEKEVDTDLIIGLCYYKLRDYNASILKCDSIVQHLQIHLGDSTIQAARVKNILGNSFKRQRLIDKSISNFSESLSISTQLLDDTSKLVTDAMIGLAIAFSNSGDYDQSLLYYKKLLQISELFNYDRRGIKNTAYNGIGIIHAERGNFLLAAKFFGLNKNLLDENNPKHRKQLNMVYNNLAGVSFMNGQFDICLEYQLKSINLYERNTKEVDYKYILFLNNLAAAYMDNGQMDKASIQLHKALDLANNLFDKATTVTASVYENLAAYHDTYKDYDSAFYYGRKAMETREKNHNKYHPSVAKIYMEYSSLHQQYGDLDSALFYLNKSINSYLQIFGKRHPNISEAYLKFGETYRKMQMPETALKYYQNALISNSLLFSDTSIFKNPTIEGNLNTKILLNVLNSKGEVLTIKFNKSGEYKYLINALSTFQLSDSLIKFTRNNHLNYEDKVDVGRVAKDIYLNAVSICLKLDSLNESDEFKKLAFGFAEKSKSEVLKGAITSISAKSFGSVPDSVLVREQELKVDISYYRTKILNAKTGKNISDSAKLFKWENQLFNQRRQMDTLIMSLQSDYPKYYNLIYSRPEVGVDAIQRALSKNTALIEYLMGEEEIFIFLITKDQFVVHKISNLISQSNLITRIRKSLQTKLDQKRKQIVEFAGLSKQCADLIINEILPELGEEINKLIVIPDGELAYIPFEILLYDDFDRENLTFQNIPYLLKKYDISYAYSANLTFGEQRLDLNNRSDVLAFAPSYDKFKLDSIESLSVGKFRSQLSDLKWNEPEIIRISDYYSTKPFSGDKATEEEFKGNVQNYGIVHLAMHALIDDRDPMNSKLIFAQTKSDKEDNFLHAYEIYNMQLPIQLAVLSACETGFGKLERGEGVNSLARAFTYAGCPSVVMSHWAVNDATTSRLMELFYMYLSAGYSKDYALRMAKLDFLNNSDAAQTNPYYWSSFVVMGDTSPINSSTKNYIWIMGLIGFVVVSMIYIVYRLCGKIYD